MVLARQAMTVDQIARGRLELGMGAGASEQDWPMTSGASPWSPRERTERLGESLEIMNMLFQNGVASYVGTHYQIAGATLAPRSVQQPRPRLTVAAHGPKGVALAARHGALSADHLEWLGQDGIDAMAQSQVPDQER